MKNPRSTDVTYVCRKHALTMLPMYLNGIRSGVWSEAAITPVNAPRNCRTSGCTKPALFQLTLAAPT